MLIARAGEEIVCPKGTVCGRLTRDANDQIIDGDFTARRVMTMTPSVALSSVAHQQAWECHIKVTHSELRKP
jgi:hypothetical protein